jgi:hypothetical protein
VGGAGKEREEVKVKVGVLARVKWEKVRKWKQNIRYR